MNVFEDTRILQTVLEMFLTTSTTNNKKTTNTQEEDLLHAHHVRISQNQNPTLFMSHQDRRHFFHHNGMRCSPVVSCGLRIKQD